LLTRLFFKQWGGVRKDLTGRMLNGLTYDEMPALAHEAKLTEVKALFAPTK